MRKPFDAEHMQAADSDQRFWGGLLAATAALTVIKVRHHDQFVTILRQLSCVLGAGPRWRLPHYGDRPCQTWATLLYPREVASTFLPDQSCEGYLALVLQLDPLDCTRGPMD